MHPKKVALGNKFTTDAKSGVGIEFLGTLWLGKSQGVACWRKST